MDWAYVAGFTDGDGCIDAQRSSRGYFHARLVWSQKAAAAQVLDALAEFFFREGIEGARMYQSGKRSAYPQAELVVAVGAEVRLCLERMLPHLVLKRAKAESTLRELEEVARLHELYGPRYRSYSLSRAQVLEVLGLAARGHTQSAIASQFGVSRGVIGGHLRRNAARA